MSPANGRVFFWMGPMALPWTNYSHGKMASQAAKDASIWRISTGLSTETPKMLWLRIACSYMLWSQPLRHGLAQFSLHSACIVEQK